ncbi:hypothetical protein PV04_09457 [Phialophora macrospora]|uniref:Uncharacterized protein n=1 Tax=Phialophora macrospora TaxID=1851006 RepID=A0A0D2FCJ2_9EURO|nr:hypothetical protein PV04_09457 [Phialophora macrospora]
MTSQPWRVLFAHRALTLPGYVPLTEWEMRIHVLVAGILRSMPDMRYLRAHHLVKAGALLELKDENPMSQQLCELKPMVASKTSDEPALKDIMVSLQKGLKKEIEKQFGVEMVIPHGTLDDELMGAIADATSEG